MPPVEAFMVSNASATALRALNYTPTVEKLRARTGTDAVPLSRLLAQMGTSYATVFARIDCAPGHGVELLSQSDMFAAEPSGRIIRRDSMSKPEHHEVKRWHVLLAGAGTLGQNELYGRALLADSRLAGKYVGQDTMILEFEQPGSDHALFTYAYLASGPGLRIIRSTSYGTKILRIRKSLLGNLPVPLPDKPTQARVAALVRECLGQREAYLTELKAARAVIEALPEMQEAHAMCAERKARAVMWNGPLATTSAWTFASAGDALSFLRRKWAGRLKDALAGPGLYYGKRSARIPCQAPHGVNFVMQRDAFLIRPVPRRVLVPGFSTEHLRPFTQGFYLAAHGTLAEGELFGRPALVAGTLAECVATQDLLRVLPAEGQLPLLYAYISTLVGLRLVRATAVGTKILTLRFDLLKEMPIPDLARQEVRRLENHLLAAVEARTAADHAEAEAIRIVEEEVLPAWLD